MTRALAMPLKHEFLTPSATRAIAAPSKRVLIKLVVGPASAKREVKSTVSPEVLAKIYELLLQTDSSKTATQPNFAK